MKVLCFMKKKPGLGRDEFIRYYEENHAPLIARLLPYYSDYRRNYLAENPTYKLDHIDDTDDSGPEFDVVTEWSFENREMYNKLLAAMGDPQVGETIARDEANFLDRSSIRVFVVEERVSR